MARKQKQEDVRTYLVSEILDMTPAQLLGRLRDLEDSINVAEASKKDAADAAIKKHSAAVAKAHYGIREPKSRPMPGSRLSGIRKRFNGRVERW